MNIPKEKKNILLTSVGGLTGTYLTKVFLKTGGFNIIGVDMGNNIPLKESLHRFINVPASNSPDYIDVIKGIVNKEKVDYIIPVSSYDMNVFSKLSDDPLLGEKMLIIDYKTNNTLHNKKNCYEFLNRIGIDTPQIYEDEVVFPLIMKPEEGSGSKGVIILQNAEELSYWKQTNNQSIIMEYLEGEEYTVDCLFDSKGFCKGYNIRKRMKTAGGGAVVTQNDYKYCGEVQKVISRLEDTKLLKGPINFQFKVKNNRILVFDFNTRFASGGLPVTVESGFNIPVLLLNIIDGKDISNWVCPDDKKNLKMIRYYEEVFVNEP